MFIMIRGCKDNFFLKIRKQINYFYINQLAGF